VFFVRGLAVSFSVFVMVYCVLSLGVSLSWHKVRLYSQRRAVRGVADFLFALRVFPFLSAAIVTAVFTVPSFLLLEPRAINEPVGEIPLALGVAGALLGLFGVVNAALASRRASRKISEWTRAAQPVSISAPVPVLRIQRTVPAMTVTGIVRPRVLLSGAAESMLSAGELRTALNHEVVHVRRQDNLRKLFLRFVAFPGMGSLEAAWLEASEMAADDAAVCNAGEALDLAVALIKLSRLGPVENVDLTAALVHHRASVMNARVERLIAWNESRQVRPRKYSPWYGLGAGLAMVAVFAVTYSQLLVHVHAATEWLVR